MSDEFWVIVLIAVIAFAAGCLGQWVTGRKMVVLLVLLLSGCTSYKTDYPSVCDIKKPDPNGQGYTMGQFPCKLSHHEGKVP